MPTVRPATLDDLPRVGTALAAAFADDPVWSWMTSPAARWSDRAAAWFSTEAALQLRGRGEVLVDHELRGAAIWSPPGRWKASPREAVALAWPSLRLFRSRTPRALRTLGLMEAQHPTPPHWYLATLGTDPVHQGHGIGSALVQAITERCDTKGLPAYLESSKEQNVAFYERHGFQVAKKLELPGGPPNWLMWREPQVTAHR